MLPLLYIVRHGETDWNVEERLQGQAETDINARGREQAARNGVHLARLIEEPGIFDFVSSPSRRTRNTMERIRNRMGLAPDAYRTDPRLKEVHFGDWQGFTYAELEEREPGVTSKRMVDKWHFLPPGREAESYEVMARRVRSWLGELKRPTICVTHGGVVRAIFHLVGGVPVQQASDLEVPQDRILRVEEGRLEWL
ncbi:histidine phosphatase family protein [Chelativorans sp. Marseille-P2723]|uniref:histidine phosphatase family protein n=1 Tax=Chelativorans sp. Marseille-P2723 TaxID=2709133 RepID=UPI001570CFFB|nr:histidine phosphatase family protein [Chelativorans sp. Marseille-P2723]